MKKKNSFGKTVFSIRVCGSFVGRECGEAYAVNGWSGRKIAIVTRNLRPLVTRIGNVHQARKGDRSLSTKTGLHEADSALGRQMMQ